MKLKTDIENPIYRARRVHGHSREECAKKLGLAPSTIQRYESGKIFPTLETSVRLAQYCGLTIFKMAEDWNEWINNKTG